MLSVSWNFRLRSQTLAAAILAMRHPRLIIFGGAFFALALMSLLSALLGHVLPTLLPRRYTTIAAAGLFFVFGARMLKEGIEMEAGTGHIEEEMREVQMELEEAEGADIEAGRPLSPVPGHKHRRSGSGNVSPPPSSSVKRIADSAGDGLRNLSLFLFSPVLVQAFILTFLAEWGDRSQITTIALAAAHVCPPSLKRLYRDLIAVQNVWIVTLGTILGHSLCTLGAVIGGRWLATKISIRNGAPRSASSYALSLISDLAQLPSEALLSSSSSASSTPTKPFTGPSWTKRPPVDLDDRPACLDDLHASLYLCIDLVAQQFDNTRCDA